jgi:2-methylcitrate dehydratase PrpD
MNASALSPRPAARFLDAMANLSMSQLPEAVTAQAARSLLDNLACGLFGACFPWGKAVAAHAMDEGAGGKATLFGRTERVSPSLAALANGTMIHGFELDDIILGSLAHPGTVVIPAALAVAEAYDAPMDRLILGIIVGYETMARLGAALGEECNTKGFHTTGVAGAIAAAVAAGVTRGMSALQIRNAVGIACSQASGIKAFTQGTGGMVKRLHGGHAASCGVVAASLASRGFTGPLDAIDGRYGLLDVIGGPTAQPDLMIQGLGDNWAIGRVWIKMFPCCGVIHSAVHGLEALRQDHAIQPDAVRSVRIGAGRRAVDQNGDPTASEPMTAQYSLQFCAGVALTGDIRDPASFLPAALQDPAVRDMISRVELYVDPDVEAVFPRQFGARLDVTTKSGERFETVVWESHGTPSDPCSDDDLERKFRRLCNGYDDRQAIERVVGVIDRIAQGSSTVSELSAALRLQPPRTPVGFEA